MNCPKCNNKTETVNFWLYPQVLFNSCRCGWTNLKEELAKFLAKF